MTLQFQPPPTYADPVIVDEATRKGQFNPIWLKWFLDITQYINKNGGGALQQHNLLGGLQGGNPGNSEYYHLSNSTYTFLTSIPTPTNGGVAYGNGSTINFTAAGTSGQVLTSNGAAPPTWTTLTSGSSILYGNGSGGFSNVTIGSGITFSGGVLSATGSGGTVTSVTGTSPVVSSGGSTPAISLASGYGDTQNPYASKTANYVLAGPTSGAAAAPTFRALVAADIPSLSYAPPTSGTSILYGNGSGGFSNVTIGSGVSFVGGVLSATGSGGTVTSVTASTPLASSGGTTPNISLTGVVPIANGGTNGTAVPTAGAVAYGTGTAYAFTAAGTAGQFLQSTGAGTPTWSTPSTGSFQPAYYATFVSTANQLNGGSTTANPVSFDTVAIANGISITSSNQLTFANAGQYVIEYELSVTSTSGANSSISAWLAKNGTNIANTTSDFTILGGANQPQLLEQQWIVSVNAGDYIQIYWSSPSTNVELIYQGAATGPTRPASPSATVNIAFIPPSGQNLVINSSTITGGTSGNILYDNAGTVGELAPAALTKTDDTNVTLTLGGTPATALLKATSLTLGWTGQLSLARGGTGNTTGQAQSVVNAVTFNNSGTGAASGTTFDGSVARTISYNTIGAQPAGSYVTSVTGTSPVVSSGGTTPAISLASGYGDTQNPYGSKTANYVLAAPNGSAGTPSFRALVAADIPSLPYQPTAAPVTYTANFSVATTDVWIINNKSGSSCTATLPAASSYTGRVLRFINYQAQTLVSASSNVVPIVGGAAGTAILNAVAGDTCTVVSDGTNWIMTQYTPNNVLLLE